MNARDSARRLPWTVVSGYAPTIEHRLGRSQRL